MNGCTLTEKVKPPFRPVRELDLLTTSGRLMDAILRHRHALLRAENGAAARLVAPLKEAQREILEELRILAARDAATGTFANLRRERLLVMQARIQKSLEFAEMEALGSLSNDLRTLQEREVEIQAALLRREIPAGISLDLVTPSPARLDRILNQPLGGTVWSTRLHERYGDLVGGMTLSLAQSVQLGEGMLQSARRMNKVTGIGIRSSVVIARTEIQRVANETAFETYVQNADVIKGIVIVETLDDRTCFPVGTMVATPDGERRIEDIHPGDIVLGGSGRPCRVAATRRKRWDGPMTGIVANGRLLWSTPDHRVLTPDGWIESADLQVEGEVVALKNFPQSIGEPAPGDLGFSQSNHSNPSDGDLGISDSISGLVGMPIVGVGLERDPVVRQKEVDRPPTDLILLNELDATRFQPHAHDDLQAGFPAEATIASNGTESCTIAREGGDDSKLNAAVLTRHDQGRAPAGLAAVDDVGALGVEHLPTSRTGFLRSNPSALTGAFGITMSVGARHGVLPLADGARFGHAATAAHVGAVDLTVRPLGPDVEHLAACGTRPLDPLGTSPFVVTCRATELLVVRPSDDVIALLASQLVHTVTITGIHRIDDMSLNVYDIQVEGDESFVAEGVVVHNCIICAIQDGKFIQLGQSGMIPPFHANCRGFVSPVVRSLEEMGLPPLEFPESTRASMDGQVPQSVTYEEWFKTQSDAFQKDRLGPTRFALFKNGDVTIDSMVKDFKIIPIANLRLPSVN